MKRARTYNPRFPGRGRTTRNRRRLHLPTFKDEVKYFDCSADTDMDTDTWTDSSVPCDEAVAPDGTTSVYNRATLNPGDVGTGYGQVDGFAYSILKLHVRGRIHHIPSLGNSSFPYKICLVLDTQPNGVQANGDIVMNSLTTGIEMAFKSMAHQQGRFVILKTQAGTIVPVSSSPSFENLGFVNAGGNGTLLPYSQTTVEVYKDEWFDFEWTPRTPRDVRILKTGDSITAAQINTNMFLILFTHGAPLACHFASRCYFRNR